MADERYKTVSTFMLPNEYQRQAAEARRRRRMAEMLAQQEYVPDTTSAAPLPAFAPLAQGISAFTKAYFSRKADEAEESAQEAQTREARDFLRALTEPPKKMTVGETALQDITQMGTPEIVDGRIEYRKTGMPAPTPEMVPQAGPQIRLGRRPEDDSVYMPTKTGVESDPQRLAALLANPEMRAEFSPEQKRALALEGVLTSQNPLVQKIGQMQYAAMQPKQPEIGAIDPGDYTPESFTDYLKTGNFGVLKLREQPAKPEAMSGLGRLIAERHALPEGDPRRAAYNSAIEKETRIPSGSTVNITNRYGSPMAAVDAAGNPVLIQPSPTGGPPSVVQGYTPPGKETAPTVSEATSVWNIGRIVNAANAIRAAIAKDPSAIKPSAQEFVAAALGDEAANAVRSPQRQIVVGEQADLLDAYLTLATGAAYTDPQFINAKRAITPTLTDDAAAIERKSRKLLELIPQAKERAGVAWTPELEQAVKDFAASLKQSAPSNMVNPASGWGKAQQVK
jgi:hypothetical protein